MNDDRGVALLFLPIKLILRQALFLLLLITVTGCQILKLNIEKKEDWRLKARTAITTPEESATATLIWQQNATESDFHLFGSLGTTYAQLHQTEDANGQRVTLNLPDDKHYQGNNAEQLLSDVLGWPFPYDALQYWVKGQPAGLNGERIERGDNQQIAQIDYDRWQIKFSRYQHYGKQLLPKIIDVRSEQFRLKIVVKSWQFGQ